MTTSLGRQATRGPGILSRLHPFMRLTFFAGILVLSAPATAVAQSAPSDTGSLPARLAWERGDYPTALRGFTALLESANGDRYLEEVALLTGELYRTTELTRDGRAVRVSPSGKLASFETGTGAGRTTYVVRLDRPAIIDSMPGFALAFAGDGRAVVLRARETDALRAERAALARLVASQDREGILTQQRKIAS